jgi:hypothetical protein
MLSLSSDPTVSSGRAKHSEWPPRRAQIAAIWAILLSTSVLTAGTVVARGQVGFFESGSGPTLVQDFASHLIFTKSVWQGKASEEGNSSAYSVEYHLRIISEWMGRESPMALPFGYSPTMLWILLPLCFLPLPIAYCLWTLLGAVGASWMLSRGRFHWVFGLTVFLTPIAVGAVALGQTAILGTVGIFALGSGIQRESTSRQEYARRDGLLLVLVLLALTAKPPLAITAGAAMLALRVFRPVLLAIALTVFSAIALTPWLGHEWVADYVWMITHYDRVSGDPAFIWSFRPDHMSNLRAWLSVDLGVADDTASLLSNLCWLGSLGLVSTAGWFRRIRAPETLALAILSYLLFCPHVSSTEAPLLVLVPALILPWRGVGHGRFSFLPWIVVPVGLLLSPALGPFSEVRPSALWFVQMGLAAWVMARALRGNNKPTADHLPTALTDPPEHHE